MGLLRRGDEERGHADAATGPERRILFVNRYFHPDRSATSQMTGSLAFALAAASWRPVAVASRQRYEDAAAGLPRRETLDGVSMRRVWTTSFGRKGLLGRALDYATFHVAAALDVARAGRRGDLLVVGTDPPLLSVTLGAVARLRGLRVVNWCQDLFPEIAATLKVKAGGGTVDRLLRSLRDRSLRGAALNVVPGERMADHLAARGVARDRILVIHNWSDGSKVRPIPPEANPLRQEWGLGGDFVVGYSGNLGRAHDFATIMAAAERLRDEPNLTFLFVGGGHFLPWVKAEATRRGLRRVVFKPLQPTERLAESLSVPDVHLASLRPEAEGFMVPSKFYGVAAAGRPLLFVGDRDGEIARLVRAADCGDSVSLGDADALAERIRQLRRFPDLRERWGRNARRAFDERYDRGHAVAAWRRALDRIAAPAEPASTDVTHDRNVSNAEHRNV